MAAEPPILNTETIHFLECVGRRNEFAGVHIMAQRQRTVKVQDPVVAVVESSLKVGAACGKSCTCFLILLRTQS